MEGFAPNSFRQYSPWLVLGISTLILVGVIASTLLWPVDSGALAGEIPEQTFSVWGKYQSPERCRQCHPSEFAAWSNTSHAQASFDPIFQVSLQQVKQPAECFACHTTGYDTNTGQFILAGVTCEACHGPYRPEHPEDSMVIVASAGMCGSCHSGTLFEWQTSRHGQVGVTCIDCHEVHSQQTRAAAATNALCFTCHQNQILDSSPHTIHIRASVHCIDCHLSHSDDISRDAPNGGAVTGHSFAVFVKTCRDCHPDELR